MKRSWEIVVKESVDFDLRRRIKRVLRPTFGIATPGKCAFCSTPTTWTINNSHVCPACSVVYGFMSADRIPDLCEVCGKQGEWCTEGKIVHSLCFTHRDTWFRWTRAGQGKLEYEKNPDLWEAAWEKNFAEFINAAR